MIDAIFFIPTGPKDTERVSWTIRSIRKFCPNRKIHLLLDGASLSALPNEVFGDDIVIIENPSPSGGHWGRIWTMQCIAMVHAAKDPTISQDAIFVKIDADAVVIKDGLVERAKTLFLLHPQAGQLGQCFTNILGGRLHNAGWANYYRKMQGWRGLLKFVSRAWKQHRKINIGIKAYVNFCRLLKEARKNGYVEGEFAIGGAYILRRQVVEAIANLGLLEASPFLLLDRTGEDGVMTPYVYATGYSAMDDVSEGGIFAIEGKAMRINPFLLQKRGHYILHPTKYGHEDEKNRFSEAQLVEKLLSTS